MCEPRRGFAASGRRRQALTRLGPACAVLVLAVRLPAAAQGVMTLPEALRQAGRASLEADAARLDLAASREKTE